MEMDPSQIFALITGPSAAVVVLFFVWRGERRDRREANSQLFTLATNTIATIEGFKNALEKKGTI
jgi:hypothetical protein